MATTKPTMTRRKKVNPNDPQVQDFVQAEEQPPKASSAKLTGESVANVSIRVPKDLLARIDDKVASINAQTLGKVSRNTWIVEVLRKDVEG